MSTSYADPEIHKILSIDGNNKCIDCGSDDPQWASMNNAVIVCLNCAGIHRNLGVEISYIRSLVMDNWEEDQLRQLSIGGNKRFLRNLEEYEIVKKNNHLSLNSEKIQQKYLFVASEYYRNLIKSELNDTEAPNKPSKEEGQVLIEINKVIVENNDHKEDTQEESEQKKKTFFGKVGSMFSTAGNKVKSTIKKTGEKIDKMDIKDTLKKAGTKTVSAVKDAGKYVSNKASEVAVSKLNIIKAI